MTDTDTTRTIPTTDIAGKQITLGAVVVTLFVGRGARRTAATV